MQIDSTSIIALIDRFGKLEVGDSFSVTKLPQGEARFNSEVERTTAGIKEEEETATIDLTGTKEEKRTTAGIKEKSATVDLTAIKEEEVTIKKEKVDAIKKEIKKKTPKTAARKMAAPRSTRRTRSQNQTKDSADEVIGTYSIPVGGATVEIIDSDDESYVDHGFSQQVEVVCSLDSP
jgi:hypothetical protein